MSEQGSTTPDAPSGGFSLVRAPLVLRPDQLPTAEMRALYDGAGVATAQVLTVDVNGPGVIQCMQGILTNDVEAPGPEAFQYAAVLTPKGMIICDMWVARRNDTVTIFPPAHGRTALLEVFVRSFPPRLARAEDRTGEYRVLELVGPSATHLAKSAGFAVPEVGRIAHGELDGASYLAARPPHRIPFELLIACPLTHESQIAETLTRAGVEPVGPEILEVARIMAGWPRLGLEIDHKTLPQEVRFEQLEGVSFTKGCFTGQETVARVHFRGHPNRGLVGLVWKGEPDWATADIHKDDRVVGHVTSAVWSGKIEAYFGLGIVRREILPGDVVSAAGAPATTTALPLELT